MSENPRHSKERMPTSNPPSAGKSNNILSSPEGNQAGNSLHIKSNSQNSNASSRPTSRTDPNLQANMAKHLASPGSHHNSVNVNANRLPSKNSTPISGSNPGSAQKVQAIDTAMAENHKHDSARDSKENLNSAKNQVSEPSPGAPGKQAGRGSLGGPGHPVRSEASKHAANAQSSYGQGVSGRSNPAASNGYGHGAAASGQSGLPGMSPAAAANPQTSSGYAMASDSYKTSQSNDLFHRKEEPAANLVQKQQMYGHYTSGGHPQGYALASTIPLYNNLASQYDIYSSPHSYPGQHTLQGQLGGV